MDEQIYDVIIVGGGLTGLTSAINLQEKGLKILILEAYDQVGGRVATDKEGEFILDRGFQVLLTEYPETKKYLDYNALNLQKFNAGALVLRDGKKYFLADPLRHPKKMLSTLLSPIGSTRDKLNIIKLRKYCVAKEIHQIFDEPEKSSRDFLVEFGFSEAFIRQFFRPFLGGIFLDDSLDTSCRMLMFVFKMFSEGYAAVPELGMEQIAKQLKDSLKGIDIKVNTKVKEIIREHDVTRVHTVNNGEFLTRKVILATDAEDLVKEYVPKLKSSGVGTTTVYFWTDKLPQEGAWLMLNADEKHIVNHLAVMSEVNKAYASKGKHLVAVNCLGVIEDNQQALVRKIREELKVYFGDEVKRWHHLRTYKIRYALPKQTHVQLQQASTNLQQNEHLFYGGDYLLHGSISGAMHCGELLADAVSE